MHLDDSDSRKALDLLLKLTPNLGVINVKNHFSAARILTSALKELGTWPILQNTNTTKDFYQERQSLRYTSHSKIDSLNGPGTWKAANATATATPEYNLTSCVCWEASSSMLHLAAYAPVAEGDYQGAFLWAVHYSTIFSLSRLLLSRHLKMCNTWKSHTHGERLKSHHMPWNARYQLWEGGVEGYNMNIRKGSWKWDKTYSRKLRS